MALQSLRLVASHTDVSLPFQSVPEVLLSAPLSLLVPQDLRILW